MSSAPAKHDLGPLFPDGILAATGNHNKVLELASVAANYGISIISAPECATAKGLIPLGTVSEGGRSYAENALIKAEVYGAWSGMPALGDDSGLEIEALGGRPGLHSARYLGEGATARERYEGILIELEELDRSSRRGISWGAAFVCHLALVFPNGEVITAEGRLEGTVLRVPRGEGGFGYDPIILIHKLGKTLAEVDFAVTCSEGFRAEAAKALFSKLPQRVK